MSIYIKMEIGNNRAVINGSTGAIEQTIAYYPYGGVIADLGTPTKGQPYKFGGKELITANGLNEYDFGARYYYPAVPHFTKPDPLCEKRPDLSTYLYCGNNPVNAIDPSGKDSWTLDSYGNIMDHVENENFDEIIVIDKKNENVNIWKGEYGTITKQSAQKDNKGRDYVFFETNNDTMGKSVFEFLAQNSSVEWSLLQTGSEGKVYTNYISTSHQEYTEVGATAIIVDNIFEMDIRKSIHSHPSNTEYPSGLEWNLKKPGDVQFAKWVDSINRNANAIYMLYIPINKKYIQYDQFSTMFDFYESIKNRKNK